MIKKVLFTFVLLCSLFLFSCENPLFARLSRTTADPFYDTPQADSFIEEGKVYLSWEHDDGADYYELRRSENLMRPLFDTLVYRGTDTSFVDASLASGKNYYYRLDKIRGGKLFVGNIPALATCSFVRKDKNEDNNTIEKATLMSSKCESNLYYYIFLDNRVLQDYDWYKVKLPPRSTATFNLTELDLPVGESESSFNCTIESFTMSKVSNNRGFEVSNTEDYERYVSFLISADSAKFRTYGDGTTRSYTLKLEKIEYK